MEMENTTSYGNELTYTDTPDISENPTIYSKKDHEKMSTMENETELAMMENEHGDVMAILAEMICHHKLNLVNVDTDKRPIGKNGKPLKDWNNLSYTELLAHHNEDSLFWGIRNGFHAEGRRYTLSLDFDMCGASHEYRSCPETCALWNEYEQTASKDGQFTSSTDGNMNVLVDYTNSTVLKEKIEKYEKAKLVVYNLEILLRGNQVIPPTMTNCKISGKSENRRTFIGNPFYVIPDDDTPDFVREFILRQFPKESKVPERKKVKREAEAEVEAEVEAAKVDKWIELLFDFIGNEKVGGAKKINWNHRFHICSMLKSNHYSKEIWMSYYLLSSDNETKAENLWKSVHDDYPIFGLVNICNAVNPFGLREWRNKHNHFIPLTTLQRGENDIAKYQSDYLADVRYTKDGWFICDSNTNVWSQRKDVTAVVVTRIQTHIDNALEIQYFKKDRATEEEKEKLEDQIISYNKCRCNVSKSGTSSQIIKCLMTYLYDEDFAERLDTTLYQLVFRNGIYNMKTRTFRCGIVPTDFVSKTIPYDWQMEADESQKQYVRHELKKICNWNEQHFHYYLTLLGYILTGDAEREQYIWFFRGQLAKNGKSVILEVLSDILGHYARKLELGFFDEKATNRHKTLDNLRGCRLVWANEVSKKRCDAFFIKEISDGTKTEYGKMYGNTTTLNVQFKCILVSNNTLDLPADSGVDRRFILMQFDSSFRAGENGTEKVDDYENRVFIQDADFPNKLKTTNRNALLHVLMDAAYDYVRNGLPPIPEEWKEDKEDMMSDNSPFKDFFESNFVVGEGQQVFRYTLDSILESYKKGRMDLKDLKDELKKMRVPYKYEKEKMYKGKKGLFKGFGIREEEL